MSSNINHPGIDISFDTVKYSLNFDFKDDEWKDQTFFSLYQNWFLLFSIFLTAFVSGKLYLVIEKYWHKMKIA